MPCQALGRTALHSAGRNGQQAAVKLLLSLGLEPNPPGCGQTPLFLAAAAGHSDAVEALLDHEDVDVNARDRDQRTPLIVATQRGNTEVVRLLLRRKDVDVNCRNPGEYDMTPLAIAASCGDASIFQLLLNHPSIDRNVVDSSPNDILMHAAFGGNDNIVEESGTRRLEFEPDPRIKDIENMRLAVLPGASALDAAASNGHDSTVRLLLSDPFIDPNPEDHRGRTPLINAAIYGHLGVVKTFLRHRHVDAGIVNSGDDDGETALTHAAEKGHWKIVNALVKYPGINTEWLLAAAAGGPYGDCKKAAGGQGSYLQDRDRASRYFHAKSLSEAQRRAGGHSAKNGRV
ncbi:ankyrin repeat-containing domain protein [Aspergillus egyptiacus]|nr:ankyrin repeat-containing domain protein [Aspergillus egyptiacus]